jgi:AGZA family xanthine/uracil permease-like MFS transporter
LFKLKEKKAKVITEIIAGITTFVTMAYIIFVNPQIVSGGAVEAALKGGMTAEAANVLGETLKSSLFVATCLSAFFGTLLMGLLANLPFAQAPGMGLNAFFAYTVMLTMGYSYPEALAIVFISGLLFLLITAVGMRTFIAKSIPKNIKIAISVGIGFFIAFIGLKNAGLVQDHSSTLVTLIDFKTVLAGENPALAFGAVVALVGLVIITVLHRFKVPGGILLGIVATTAVYYAAGIPLGLVEWAGASIDVSTVGSQFGTWAKTSLFQNFTNGFQGLFDGKSLLGSIATVFMVVISFSLVDMFDTLGTLLGTARNAKMLDENGELPEMKKAMYADSIATTVGACMGTPTVTTYVESSAGVSVGGKTGLTSVVTAILFLGALFAAPFIGLVPDVATAPVLIFVGVLMIGAVKELDFDDFTEIVPAFVTIAFMPFTYSIANGIAFGLITHLLIKLLTLKLKDISITEIILVALFIVRFFFMSA